MNKSDIGRSGGANRTDSPFTPPAQRSLLPWVVLVVALGVGGVWGYGQFVATQVPEAVVPAGIAPAEPPVDGGAGQWADAPPAPPVVLPSISGSAQDAPTRKRCTLDGRVTYTDATCPPGAQVAEVDLTPNSGWTGATSAGRTTLQRCKTADGRFFWSASPCRLRQAFVDRYASVTAGVPFEQQVREAEMQRRAAATVSNPAPARLTPAAPVASPPHQKAQQCEALDDTIDRLDAWARQPLSASRQDWIRSQRKEARDRQFALKC